MDHVDSSSDYIHLVPVIVPHGRRCNDRIGSRPESCTQETQSEKAML